MSEIRVIEVNENVYAANDEIAEKTRHYNRENHTFLMNLMASPGAGKTSVLLRTAKMLEKKYSIGVMEADIDYQIDAEKMQKAGIRSIQVHTGGACAMDAEMTAQAIKEFHADDLDLLVLENVGNLVCPAENDTGASINVEVLSVPEGDDKPLKYPLMFTVCQAVLINKTDTLDYFRFDKDAVTERIRALNPDCRIFFVSARTGEGFDKWTEWLSGQIDGWIQ